METLEKTKVKNEELVNGMNEFLAGLQVFYQNLRGFHWNVEGSLFFVLHSKFEEYYNETSEAVDEVAERILMIGGKPIHAFSDYIKVSEIPEVTNVRDGKEAVNIVLAQSKTLLDKMNNLMEMAGNINDEGTVAMLSEMISGSEKRIWMLKTFLR
jgi:starvation-inducible DNA-binding protein